MDSGYIELAELNQRLRTVESMSFRMALVRVENNWTVHTLILEDIPTQDNGEGSVLDHDYGSVLFVAGIIGGDTASKWLFNRRGEVTPSGKTGLVRAFTLPPFNSKVNWRRLASHAPYDYERKPWPITRYDATGSVGNAPFQFDGFLVGRGLPFFPDLKTAILTQVYQAKDPQEIQNSTLNQSVIVRVADTSAWLNQIILSPTEIKVNVTGTQVPGSQLTISGSSRVQFQEQLPTRTTVECPLPNGVPSPLWIVLSHGDQWLDYYHRDERWPLTNQTRNNVTIEAGDTSTEIAGIIAQGEGLTTEFKEEVPEHHDQLLKTVAAFANGDGGVILLGVKDSTGELVGFAGNPDDLTQMIRKTVFPEPTVQITTVNVEQRRIVVIYVQKGASVPYGLHETNTRYYVRRGATTFPARPEELRAIVLARQPAANGPFAGYVR